ncbi:MAG: thiamine ABC transporter substrate-binding protein [Propionibacterium sp.]|nr:thiamine ABC transporter substrate-binding protein [Propionibacterium sp.]
MKFRPLLAAFAGLALVACGQPADEPGTATDELVVITHESFSIPDELKDRFAEDTGLDVTYQTMQDTGSMVNQLILTKDAPLGDVVFGVDNTFASRAIGEGVFDDYVSDARAPGGPESLPGLTPIDFGDVCVNADLTWFEAEGLPLPETLADLTDDRYRDLFVAPSPATSSPGLAFLFTTVGAHGDGWLDYWRALDDNGAITVSGWTQAYNVEFSAGEGGGDRPLVLSYSTSPAWTIGDDGESTTASLLDTCFRQVEYAGVLAGAENPDAAAQFVDFLLSPDVQASIPDHMFMYPADTSVELPEEWVRFAPLADEPFEVSSEDIEANREQWIQEWTEAIG